jgi:cardiolipin synthase
MHEKLVVIDTVHAIVGGVNFADRYNDVNGVPAWLDYAVYVQGQAAYELYKYCSSQWHIKTKAPACLLRNLKDERCSVKVSRNDWVKGKHEIWKAYFNAFNQAEEAITIMCSYFLPGRVLRSRLSLAAKRGVRIKIILAGPSGFKAMKESGKFEMSQYVKQTTEL